MAEIVINDLLLDCYRARLIPIKVLLDSNNITKYHVMIIILESQTPPSHINIIHIIHIKIYDM